MKLEIQVEMIVRKMRCTNLVDINSHELAIAWSESIIVDAKIWRKNEQLTQVPDVENDNPLERWKYIEVSTPANTTTYTKKACLQMTQIMRWEKPKSMDDLLAAWFHFFSAEATRLSFHPIWERCYYHFSMDIMSIQCRQDLSTSLLIKAMKGK